MFKVVLKPQTHSWMHREDVDVSWAHPFDALALAACPGLAPEQSSCEGDGELLADLAVVVGHDMVGVGVGAGERLDLHVVAGLFLNLTDDSVGDGLAGFVAASG